jgi:hypothetical protein
MNSGEKQNEKIFPSSWGELESRREMFHHVLFSFYPRDHPGEDNGTQFLGVWRPG